MKTPTKATILSSFLAAPNRNRVRILTKSCPENQSFKSNDSDSSPETTNETQGDQKSMSRRQWMMTCACLSPALITNAYTLVSLQNAAALDKKPGVCRNCQGFGAVLYWSDFTGCNPNLEGVEMNAFI
ncbi:unnamed protein product [Eruca vesicaria subsp. sativa]|uniref:Uncharacterized protein n=1 Tax=Eruca vesicaria subsp. sativa TaxID=29727 RepID=A0ABC8M2P7_ERUVS|nr:unnamed protein product [Eruca vesicaria subsp. sativa]